MKTNPYWGDGGWLLRTYTWKGEPYIAVYRGRRRLGVIRGEPEIAHELAKLAGGKVIELGEVRETPTIQVKQWTCYEPFEAIGNGWGSYDGPSTKAEIEEADANRPGWDD